MTKRSLAVVAASLFLSGVWPADAAVAQKVVPPGTALFNILEKAKTYNYDFNFSNQLQSVVNKKANQGAKIDFKISGSQTAPNKSLVTVSANFDASKLKAEFPIKKAQLQADLAENGKTAYLRLKNYPGILDNVFNVAAIKNKWIKVNESDLKEVAKNLGMSKADQKTFETVIKNSQDEKKIQAQIKAIRKSGAAKITRRLNNAYYDKKLVKRWEFSVDKNKWLNLQIELSKTNGSPLTSKQIVKMKEDLKKTTFGKGEFALNSLGDYVKIKVPYSVTQKTDAGSETTKSTLEITFKDINSKKIKIEIPKKTIDLKQTKNLLLSE